MIERFIRDHEVTGSAELFSTMFDVLCQGAQFIEKQNPFAYSADILNFSADVFISLKNSVRKVFKISSGTTLSAADLDAGVFAVGTDYYVYLCDDGASGLLKISASSTFPAGYSADSSRKIGGFHYGHIRKVSTDGLWVPIDSEGTKFGSGSISWKNNVTIGILPNSVWDLKNRPKCSPEGMVKIGNHWVDIYQSSAAETLTFLSGTNGLHVSGGRLQSKYGQLPVTGTEGANWYTFAELASRSGKRLLSYGEWCKAAFGNPQGEDAADNFGWTKTTNSGRARTGVRVNNSTGAYDAASGVKPYAIGAFNTVDTVGNVYEWLDDIGPRVSTDDAVGAFAWRDVLGAGMGQAYLASPSGLAAYIAGGHWGEGVRAGPRALNADNYPWYVSSVFGCRLACDAA
jgi:formylglycine-generating enzyme required for sulfatase activity